MATERYRETRRKRGGWILINREEADEKIEACLKRVFTPKERDHVRPILRSLVYGNAVPMEILESIPQPAKEVGKTRFDQLYDACMYLAFPGYHERTMEKLLGPGFGVDSELKIWRAAFPDKFGISHVVLRAKSYQEAFALACDYACRMSLKISGKIPGDLTIRVMFVSEKAVRKMLNLRWANRVNRRRKFQRIGRVYSPKEILGARIVALGRPDNPSTKVFRYAETRDLVKILKAKGLVRVSAVEAEVRRKDKFGTVVEQIILGNDYGEGDVPDEEKDGEK